MFRYFGGGGGSHFKFIGFHTFLFLQESALVPNSLWWLHMSDTAYGWFNCVRSRKACPLLDCDSVMLPDDLARLCICICFSVLMFTSGLSWKFQFVLLEDVFTFLFLWACSAAAKVSREKHLVPAQFDNLISSVSCLVVLSPDSSSVLNP